MKRNRSWLRRHHLRRRRYWSMDVEANDTGTALFLVRARSYQEAQAQAVALYFSACRTKHPLFANPHASGYPYR